MICFECSAPATEQHHIVPQSRGGTKTVPLCWRCHCLVHDAQLRRSDDHARLTREGLVRARQRGVKLGRPSIPKETQERIIELRASGLSYRGILAAMGDDAPSFGAVYNAVQRAKA